MTIATHILAAVFGALALRWWQKRRRSRIKITIHGMTGADVYAAFTRHQEQLFPKGGADDPRS